MLKGQDTRGKASSTTVIVNEQFDPPGMVQVTIVEPTEKNEPEVGVQVAWPPQAAETSGGGYATFLPHRVAFGPVSVITSLGQVIVQGATVTVKLHEAVLPDVSVAVQVTVVVPSAKSEPDGGLQAEVTPGQLSVAVGAG